ncbi:unnamed protein product [Diamesa serratosioi]
MIYQVTDNSPSPDHVDLEYLIRYYAKFNEHFFCYCESELFKINTFYSEKVAEATRKFSNLRSELARTQEALVIKDKYCCPKKKFREEQVSVRKLPELELAFSDYYLSLVLLQNYQNLNYIGFRKILKKYDKLLAVNEGACWRKDHVENARFHTNNDINRLIRETENIVTTEIEGGNRIKALKKLKVPSLREQKNPYTSFKIGLFSGSFIVLAIAVIISALLTYGSSTEWKPAFRLYRGPLLIIEFLFLWGFNIQGWRNGGVNHVLIFEINPRSHISQQSIMEIAAIFGVIWCISVLSFIYSPLLSIPAYINPLVLYILMAAFLLNPTKTLQYEARLWTLKIVGRVLLTPFHHMTFADFWIAHQLNSIVTALLDIQYFFCFYSTNWNWHKVDNPQQCVDGHIFIRSIIAMIPAYIRFAQCLRRYKETRSAFPHLANAAKYSCALLVVVFSYLTLITSDEYGQSTRNPFFYFWILFSLCSSFYSYTWDIMMDWGLFKSKVHEHRFLRDELIYSTTWFYYFGIVENFLVRFGWTLSILLVQMRYVDSEFMLSILGPCEVFRRFVWNYFQLENEHLNNCGHFRAINDISVAPMDISDKDSILRMMDDYDGVTNHRSPKNNDNESTHNVFFIDIKSEDHIDFSYCRS